MGTVTIDRKLTGVCENMPPAARSEREEALLQLIQYELQARGGSGEFDSVLAAVASSQRIAISQLKHGLNRGIAFGTLSLMADPSHREALIVSSAS